jgi:hypothetical protein
MFRCTVKGEHKVVLAIDRKINGAYLLLAGLAASAVLGQPSLAGEKSPVDNKQLPAFVDSRVEGWQPTRGERRLDDIGWAQDIRDALRLAKIYNRPVFLFTYSGSSEREHAMALQRC